MNGLCRFGIESSLSVSLCVDNQLWKNVQLSLECGFVLLTSQSYKITFTVGLLLPMRGRVNRTECVTEQNIDIQNFEKMCLEANGTSEKEEN